MTISNDVAERKRRAIERGVETRERRRIQRIYEICKAILTQKALSPSSHCTVCYRELTDDVSIKRAIGPECWQQIIRGVEYLRDLRAQDRVTELPPEWQPPQHPTREEWAERRRTHGDGKRVHHTKPGICDYASATEIRTAINGLQQLFAGAGTEMSRLKRAHGSLFQQKGETHRQHYSRTQAMPEQQRAVVQQYYDLQSERQRLKDYVEILEQNKSSSWLQVDRLPPPLAELYRRYVAHNAEMEAAEAARIAALPIDDAAWAAELAARRRDDAQMREWHRRDREREIRARRAREEQTRWMERFKGETCGEEEIPDLFS